jgi:quercetin dioxygenase-like cupin family protein
MTDNIVIIDSNKMNSKLTHERWADMGYDSGIRGKRILNECDGCESYLIKMEQGSKTVIHSNPSQYEGINIREGRLRNNVTGETYNEGDVVVFDVGDEIALECEDGSYVFCVMGSDKERVCNMVSLH